METKFVNFKKVEIAGVNKNVAIADANLGFDIAGDATQAYKNWMAKQSGAVTEKDITLFMQEYLQKKVKMAAGVGYSITIESAVADTRERPWTITDHKNEKGKRKYTTVYKLVDKKTNETLAVNAETKASAKQTAKEIIAKHAEALTEGMPTNFSGKGICYYEKVVTEGEPVAFEFEYTPSKSQKNGRWLVFGVER